MKRQTTGEGAILRAKIGLARSALDVASSQLWLSPNPAAAYTRYLSAMYPVTRAAVPLMRFARGRCLRRLADPLSPPLIAFLTRHIREERGHHGWVRSDLAALGSDPAQLDGALPVPAVTGLIGAQYQLIVSVHPVALLGCIAVLEGDPPSEALLEHVRAATGQAGAAATLTRHAVSDAVHATAAFTLLDRMHLDAHLRAAVGFSALHTARQAIALFSELADRARPSPPGISTADLCDGEAAMLADIEHTCADLSDVVAHAGDVAGGLFL